MFNKDAKQPTGRDNQVDAQIGMSIYNGMCFWEGALSTSRYCDDTLTISTANSRYGRISMTRKMHCWVGKVGGGRERCILDLSVG